MKLKLFLLPVSLILIVFIFIFLIKPGWSNYLNDKKSLESESANLQKLKGNENKLNEALSLYNQIGIDKKLLADNSIPSAINEENFLKELVDLSSDSGVNIVEVGLAKAKKSIESDGLEIKKDVETTNIEVSLEGTYFGLKKAIYSIENMNRFVGIDKLVIVDSDNTDNLILTLNLEIFHSNVNDSLSLVGDNKYFNNLLLNGLNVDILDNYLEYREETIDFSLIKAENIGKEDLFNSLNSEVEGEIEEEVEVEIEENIVE